MTLRCMTVVVESDYPVCIQPLSLSLRHQLGSQQYWCVSLVYRSPVETKIVGEEHIYERDATETTVRVDRSHCETAGWSGGC